MKVWSRTVLALASLGLLLNTVGAPFNHGG